MRSGMPSADRMLDGGGQWMMAQTSRACEPGRVLIAVTHTVPLVSGAGRGTWNPSPERYAGQAAPISTRAVAAVVDATFTPFTETSSGTGPSRSGSIVQPPTTNPDAPRTAESTYPKGD